jgi:hypothetical protein
MIKGGEPEDGSHGLGLPVGTWTHDRGILIFRQLLRSTLLSLLSVLVFLASGEAVLRVIYRDQGKATLGGPGGLGFEHLFMRDNARGRFDIGPRHPGKERLLVVGDSISWGLGVRDWSAVWTEQLAQGLERRGTPLEMAVLAEPGRNMWEHVAALEEWGSRVHPDVLIYQWYVNDVEVVTHRPEFQRAWQRGPQHARLRKFSYLYYFLDHMAASWLPLERSYGDYMLQDFRPGSYAWAEFERAFHSFATRAGEVAPTRLMVLYPQVPFRGPYPLQPIHDRMSSLAGPHQLAIPPAAWVRLVGTMEPRSDATWQQVVHVPADVAGAVIETRDYYVRQGVLDVGLRLACDSVPNAPAVLAVEAVDNVTNQVVGRGNTAIDMRARGWQQLPVRIDVRNTDGHSVRVRLVSPGALGFSLASIDIPVDYGFTVVNLTERLNTFNTHASMFDAHPNARAHAVMAEEVLAALERRR